ncbi:unnamed protein product [Dicrocoelium dendriticum]|nr:unnamed protein product [Dicrocoelium dendriticum]
MDNRPLASGKGYQINWDEVDSMSDPFGKRDPAASRGNSVSVNSMGDGPDETPVTTGIRKPNSPSHPVSADDPSYPPNSSLVNGNEANHLSESPSHSSVDLPATTSSGQTGPAPADLAEALERVAITDTPRSDEADVSSSSPFPPHVSSASSPSPHPNQVLNRIDSSTRPASPNLSGLRGHPSVTDDIVDSSKIEAPVTENEVLSLRKERDDLVRTIEEMKRCIAEYDRSLQHLVEEKSRGDAHLNVSMADLMAERDQAVEEVATIEKAFGDLHRRFEKSKQIIEGFKQNEESLKRSIAEYKSLLQRQETKYMALKQHAEDKLLKVSQETEAAKQEAETNAARLQASLRMLELQNRSLEAQLEQKKRENAELTKICEELLSKYSGTG